jgi:hypothetical protein
MHSFGKLHDKKFVWEFANVNFFFRSVYIQFVYRSIWVLLVMSASLWYHVDVGQDACAVEAWDC